MPKKPLTEKQQRANKRNLDKGEDTQNAKWFIIGSVYVFSFWIASLWT